ncbi:uncharacterized protein [Nicotiana sylvestris]|uniref:uncharacterized protein n=1 Tax=Nicotiana sylvestris TaxID=4096 RepID=UPI00388C95AD
MEFYKSLMGPAALKLPAINKEIMKQGPMLSQQQRSQLVAEISDQEIFEGLQSIGDDKSLGVDAVKEFFTTGKLYKALNCTTLTLIPKVDKPDTVTDFRPIAYCTLLYKMISKVMENLGFPTQFTGWIMECVKIVNYTILINGETTAPFDAKKDLGKGILCPPSYLLLGDLSSVNAMHKCFNQFAQASRLQANMGKSSMYFGGVPRDERNKILQLLGYGQGEMPFKYPGIPLSTKKDINDSMAATHSEDSSKYIFMDN